MPQRAPGSLRRHVLLLVCSGLFIVVVAFPAPPPGLPTADAVTGYQEVKVWAIVPSKVYHCPGSRWYGKTKDGEYLGECQALRGGYHPYLGRDCGSECGTTPATN